MTSGVAVYQSHRQSKIMETQQENLRELSESPDFLEHVAQEHLRTVGKNEMLFRFEEGLWKNCSEKF
jgi:hypothetical protein